MAGLAAIEGAATPYADRAFSEISIESSMGTGAAQIAVAGGHLQALEKVELLMDQLLATLPGEAPIPWDQRNRLYEMAQALAYGGQAAQEHVSPLRELMNREVESNATMFGMEALPPRRMCPLLAYIFQIPIAATEYKYCDPQSEDSFWSSELRPDVYYASFSATVWFGVANTGRERQERGRKLPGRSAPHFSHWRRLGKIPKAVIAAVQPQDQASKRGAPAGSWLEQMMARKPRMLVTVPLANKTARISWALLLKQEDYKAPVAAAA